MGHELASFAYNLQSVLQRKRAAVGQGCVLAKAQPCGNIRDNALPFKAARHHIGCDQQTALGISGIIDPVLRPFKAAPGQVKIQIVICIKIPDLWKSIVKILSHACLLGTLSGK
ncbi:hypothetical protein SDC9_192270 [bioreactor metagenome]|uniref:Uncharacterized protein n=1 Tax=bioreactor metagenome TaxID=1076179 RepID=A0A645I0A8_9ZZZZ